MELLSYQTVCPRSQQENYSTVWDLLSNRVAHCVRLWDCEALFSGLTNRKLFFFKKNLFFTGSFKNKSHSLTVSHRNTKKRTEIPFLVRLAGLVRLFDRFWQIENYFFFKKKFIFHREFQKQAQKPHSLTRKHQKKDRNPFSMWDCETVRLYFRVWQIRNYFFLKKIYFSPGVSKTSLTVSQSHMKTPKKGTEVPFYFHLPIKLVWRNLPTLCHYQQ